MDEYNTGMDPEVKRYFRKIIRSFSMGLLWLIVISTAGLFFDLGPVYHGVKWYNILFYSLAIISLFALLYYFYRVWKK